MIKQYVQAHGEYVLGQLLTDWPRAKQIMKRVSKWKHLNFYVQIDDLSGDEAKALEAHLPKKMLGDCGKNGYECMVRLYGPWLKTTKPEMFFVVQVGDHGSPNVSTPLSREQAMKSARSAVGVKSYVCEIIDVVDSSTKGSASSIYQSQLV